MSHCCCSSAKYTYNDNTKQSTTYKRTLRSNTALDHWNIRNNSAQISSVLTPEILDQRSDSDSSDCCCDIDCCCRKSAPKTKEVPHGYFVHSKYHARCFSPKPQRKFKHTKPKRTIIPSQRCDKCMKGGRNYKFKNECYCVQPPDKPFLPGKPNKKTARERDEYCSTECPRFEVKSTHSIETLEKAKSLLGYSPESEFLKRLRKAAKEVFSCDCHECKFSEENPEFKYTSRRQMLEEAYKNLEGVKFCPSKFDPDLDRQENQGSYRLKAGEETLPSNLDENFSRNFSAGNSTRNSKSLAENCEKIHKVRHIREDNYFDCHSTDYLLPETVPEHKCVHKFTLDDRLLPKPLNADVYGISRCIICNKPMENKTVHSNPDNLHKNSRSSTVSSDNENDTELVINTAKSSRSEISRCPKLKPSSARTINIGNKTDVIQLKIPPGMISQQNNVRIKKSFAPPNSWALRYQKGVI